MNAIIEPNIHPLLVHFAYALMTTGAIAMLFVSLVPGAKRRDTLKTAGDWMIAFGAAAILATVAAGFQAYYSVAHDGPSHEAMTTHRNWAVPTATLLLGLSFWRWRRRKNHPSAVFALVFLAAAMSLSVTAWWGGRLVYGHGLGVASLPAAEGAGDGHDHDHGQEHSDVEGRDSDPMTTDHDDAHDHEGDHHEDEAAAPDEPAAAPLAADYPESPESVAEAFAAALRAGDEIAVRRLLTPDVIIAEGGGAERSLEEYAEHHMPADMEFTGAVETTVKDRKILASGDMAGVITESQIHGEYKDKTIHMRMIETMVLRHDDGRWRIAHIHWSSAPITGEHEH
jgi:uncharacterized membrane protein/ketosteroid isomerase-like protein